MTLAVAPLVTSTKPMWPAAPVAVSAVIAPASPETLVAAGVVQALVVAYLSYRGQKLKRESERNTEHIEATDRLIKTLQEQTSPDHRAREFDRKIIANLHGEVIDLNRRMVQLESGAWRLVGQLEQNGLEPVWRPPVTPPGSSPSSTRSSGT